MHLILIIIWIAAQPFDPSNARFFVVAEPSRCTQAKDEMDKIEKDTGVKLNVECIPFVMGTPI